LRREERDLDIAEGTLTDEVVDSTEQRLDHWNIVAKIDDYIKISMT